MTPEEFVRRIKSGQNPNYIVSQRKRLMRLFFPSDWTVEARCSILRMTDVFMYVEAPRTVLK